MTSCATVMNDSYVNIKLHTTEASTITYKQDTITTVNNKAQWRVERKNTSLKVIASTDSLTKAIEVKPKNSFMYWANIFCNYGIGMFADRNNPKRYTYPLDIYINSTDTASTYDSYGEVDNKGEIHLHLSLPHINSFHLRPEGEGPKVNTGFWGLSVAVDYYHSSKAYISLGASSASDFFVPVPAAVDISGEYELMSSRHVSLSNNHRVRRFTFGYGLCYARNTWDFKYYDRFEPPPPTRDPVKKSHNAMGLILSSYFQTGEHFHIGVVYRPTFYRSSVRRDICYEHLVSVDFAWKIRLTNK